MILSPLLLITGLVGLCLGASQPSNQTLNCSHREKIPGICLEIGGNDPLDRELHREEFQKSGFIFFKKSEDVVFPLGGSSSSWFMLTSVNVTNLMPKGKEGLVTLTEGGVGHQNVTLHLESQRSEGYHFLVVIRGKDKDANVKEVFQTKTKQK